MEKQKKSNTLLNADFTCELYGDCILNYFVIPVNNESLHCSEVEMKNDSVNRKTMQNTQIFGIGIELWTADQKKLIDSANFPALTDSEEKALSIIRILHRNTVTPVAATDVIDEFFCPYHQCYSLVV